MENNISIVFGICTFNRKDILIKSARSLYRIKGIEEAEIRVYDDCSTEYDEQFLQSLFPNAIIVRNSENSGADQNTSLMYEDFLKSGKKWLFNADSDLLYRSDLLCAIQQFKDSSNGFMSFFNCITHNTIDEGEVFLEKDSVGAAGCLLHKDIVETILNSIKYRATSFDVNFCKLLRDNGLHLYTTKVSYVQHIGVSGYNSRSIFFDYGENFKCDNLDDGQAINQAFEEYIQAVAQFAKTKKWKVFYSLISLPRKKEKVKRILKGLKHDKK